MSGPLLDRIDLRVDVPAVRWADLSGDRPEEPTEAVRERVLEARSRARARANGGGDGGGAPVNARIPHGDLERVCRLGPGTRALLATAVDRLGLSARGYHRTLRIARTIADLASEAVVTEDALAEATRYRGPSPGSVP